MEARAAGIQQYTWIDAHNGSILLSFNQRPDALDREVFDGLAMAGLPGTLCRDEGDPISGDADCDDAYDFLGDTYDYFFTTHGRDSYDDAGATLSATVDHCPDGEPCPYPNAFWDPDTKRLVFGAGFVTDDVAAHEMTHAVIDSTAKLFYYMQSGALNESFADIFGETVDLGNAAGNDDAAVRWHIGEDLAGGATRNMLDPNSPASGAPDPAKMSDPAFVCGDPIPDLGGVHSNSGVPNHAFALMTDGGAFNSITVTGIGLAKAAKIQYRALTVHLLSAANFVDNYNALQQSCTELIGTDGITQSDCDEVKKALDAVEMSLPWPCGGVQAGAMGCPAGFAANELFVDDLENPASGNWVIKNLSGVTHWSYPPDSFFTFATSGTLNLFGETASALECQDAGFPTCVGDSVIEMTTDVAITQTGSRFEFKHAYGFENQTVGGRYVDGGLVEYSADGGVTWLDAGPMISAGASYGEGLTGIYGDDNPLVGRSAFVGDSFGYTVTQVDLSMLTGNSVRLRFRIGTDQTVGDFGWYLDDIKILECNSAPEGQPTLTSPVPGSLLAPPNVTFTWTADGEPVTGWQLLVGSQMGDDDLFDSGALASNKLSANVTSLPYTYLPIFARLRFEVGDAWEFVDYAFTVGGSTAIFGIVEDIELADFNKDGNLDAALPVDLGGSELGFVDILLGDGSGRLGLAAGRFQVGLRPKGLAVGDFNLDSNQDIAVVHNDSTFVSILLGDGAGAFGPETRIPLNGPGMPGEFGSDITVGYMDANSNPDLVVVLSESNIYDDNVRVLLGDGTGLFTQSTAADTEGNSIPRSVVLADFNKDGKLDVATGNGNTNNEGVALFLGDGLGGLGIATSFAVAFIDSVDSADFNLDENPDILADQSILLGDGLGAFTVQSAGVSNFNDLLAAEFNGDQQPDVVGVIDSFNDPSAVVFLGNGGGAFDEGPRYRIGAAPKVVATGDLNNDGRPDIVTKSDAGISVILNVVPTVTSLSVTNGPETGGTAVTITGTRFVDGATVTFGATPASSVSFVSSTRLDVTAPAGSGQVDVTVTNPDSQSSTLTNGYTYNPAPTVTSLSVTNGPETGGTAVTIMGTNFVDGATAAFGATPASSVSFVNSTQLDVTTPGGSGQVDVTVTNPDSQSATLTNGYTYDPVPPSCPVDLVLENQTLSGSQTLQATKTATLGPNLTINGNNISVKAPIVSIFGGTSISGNFSVENTPSCP